MKAQQLTVLATTAITAGLTSCIWETDPVPEMPYRPQPIIVQQADAPQAEQLPQQETTWETAPAPTTHITEASKPTPAPKPANTAVQAKPVAAPAPQPTPQPISHAPENSTYTAPLPEPAPAPQENPPVGSTTDLKLITNDGPIPTAARVEGDPTRVWNPLDPSKTIRIINPKTNQPYPSGKKLKVRGTNYQFIVP